MVVVVVVVVGGGRTFKETGVKWDLELTES